MKFSISGVFISSSFSKFCINSNEYRWLIYYLIQVKRYDSKYRSTEIHGNSRIANDILFGKEKMSLLITEWTQEL